MTTITTPETNEDDDLWEPSDALVNKVADLVAKEHGNTARLWEVESFLENWPEGNALSEGQIETLAYEVRDELAARDNGRRR